MKALWQTIVMPLAWLLFLAILACFLGFGLLQLFGDVLPLHKTISKLTLILLLLGVFPLRKRFGFSWSELGFADPARFFKQLGSGLLLALITLAPVLLLLYGLDVHIWDDSRTWTPGKLAGRISLALLTSILIGVGEELLFRGLLLSWLRRSLPLLAAIALSSLYYAALHFLKSKSQIPYPEQTLVSGFQLMAEAFANWLNPNILSALIALFMVGSFLAVIRASQTNSLGLCIGCHAGWVWQIKLSKDLCNLNPHSDYLFLVSKYDGVIGPLVSVWLGLALFLWLKLRTKHDY